MQEEHQTMNVIYEARRRARGPEQDVPRPRWRRRLLLTGISLLVVVAAGVGLYVQWVLTRAVTVSASVRAAVVDLSAGADARMEVLSVSTGDRVTKGQELARLDDLQARAALAAVEAEKLIAESNRAQAHTLLQIARARVETQSVLARRQVEIAKAGVAEGRASLALREAQLPAQVQRARADVDAAQAALKALKDGARKEEIAAAKLRLATEKGLEALYVTELFHTEKLFEKQYDSKYNLEATRTKYQAQQNKVQLAELEIALLEAGARPEEITEAAGGLAARHAALALAQAGGKEVDLLSARLVVRQSELRRAEADVVQAEAGKLEVALAEERVKAADAELKRAEAEVQGRQAALAGMVIVSPVEGTIIRTFHRPGEMCRRGEPVIMVADDAAGRWVEGYVRERDALRVRVGQSARIELIGSGSVVDAGVAAVGLCTSSLARPAGEGGADAMGTSELVWVRLKPNEKMDHSLPGMSARVVIVLE